MKKDTQDPLNSCEIDSYLFGENLSETLKAAKAINKSGAEMKTTPQQKSTAFQLRPGPPRSFNTKAPAPAGEAARKRGGGCKPLLHQPCATICHR